jgi:hypothetical protein
MSKTTKRIVFALGLTTFLGAAAAAATGSHHKFCVPQGTKLDSSCRAKGYSHGAEAHFKADKQAEKRARAQHSTKE